MTGARVLGDSGTSWHLFCISNLHSSIQLLPFLILSTLGWETCCPGSRQERVTCAQVILDTVRRHQTRGNRVQTSLQPRSSSIVPSLLILNIIQTSNLRIFPSLFPHISRSSVASRFLSFPFRPASQLIPQGKRSLSRERHCNWERMARVTRSAAKGRASPVPFAPSGLDVEGMPTFSF